MLDDKRILEVLEISKYYKIPDWIKNIKRHICENIDIHNASDYLLLADKIKYNEIKFQILNFIKKNLTAILNNEEFVQFYNKENFELMKQLISFVNNSWK